MTGFYVEVWQRSGRRAEQHANVATFEAAAAWLDDRLADDPHRLPRLRGYLDEAQQAMMFQTGYGAG